jgi:hypothetical protein
VHDEARATLAALTRAEARDTAVVREALRLAARRVATRRTGGKPVALASVERLG